MARLLLHLRPEPPADKYTNESHELMSSPKISRILTRIERTMHPAMRVSVGLDISVWSINSLRPIFKSFYSTWNSLKYCLLTMSSSLAKKRTRTAPLRRASTPPITWTPVLRRSGQHQSPGSAQVLPSLTNWDLRSYNHSYPVFISTICYLTIIQQ